MLERNDLCIGFSRRTHETGAEGATLHLRRARREVHTAAREQVYKRVMKGEVNLATAFRFSSSLVAVLDASDGRIVDVNPAFERELGYTRAEVIGKRTIDIDF